MSQRLNYGDSRHGLGNMVYVAGNFTTAGVSSPSVFSNGPFVVTRSAASELTITLKENAVEILAAFTQLQGATGNNDDFKVKSSSPGTATASASVVLESQTADGTAGDLTGIVCHFMIVYRKGALKK